MAKSEIQNLYERKRELWYQAQQLTKVAEGEERLMSEEEHTTFKELTDEMQALQKQIDVLEQVNEIRGTLNQPIKNDKGETIETVEERTIKYNAAIQKWFKRGMSALNADERKILGVRADGNQEFIELRANPGNATSFSNMQTTDVVQQVERAKKYYGGWLSACNEFRTPRGNTMNWPTVKLSLAA